ncbi:hypothetical protein HPHPA9_1259, partial [Helicobacter pylori Hp A-9]
HKLFKNDAKIAESLKPATTKNLSPRFSDHFKRSVKIPMD